MIVSPANWDYIYREPTLSELEQVMFDAVRDTGCCNLCLSGGIDSSLTLHFMSQIFPSVKCFTIASSPEHPDAYYSRLIANTYNATHLVFCPTKGDVQEESLATDLPGDVAVRLLFKFIAKYVDKVVSTDCIDELDCGYYRHQQVPTDETFRTCIRELGDQHLIPLDHNSGTVMVCLPYATEPVVNMFLRIPINRKVGSVVRKKHVVEIASKYLPPELIGRRKYGFCSALEEIRR